MSEQKAAGTGALLISAYISAVWGTYIYLNITQAVRVILLFMVFLFLAHFVIFRSVYLSVNRVSLTAHPAASQRSCARVFLLSALSAFALLMVWFAAYYPGSFSEDSIDQLTQALEGRYSDWHPVWHTLCFFTLPLKLTGKIPFIAVFQILCFSAAMGYACTVIAKYISEKISAAFFLFVMLNPLTGFILLVPWKDVAFAAAGLVCMSFSLEIYYSKGKWGGKAWQCILFAVIWGSTFLFRHNAPLFTLPLLAALFFFLEKKHWLRLAALSLLFVILVKGPLYHWLEVEDPRTPVVELTGLPLTVIGNAAKEAPGDMDDELKEFVYSIAPQEEWENVYTCGSFNALKFTKTDFSSIEEKGIPGILRLMCRCFRSSPGPSLKALIKVTSMVYGFETGLVGNTGPGIAANPYGIQTDRNETARALVSSYSQFINSTVFRYLRTLGIVICALIAVLLRRPVRGSADRRKKIFLCSSVLIYDFGTMLLLSGPDLRFFYITFTVAPLAVILSLFDADT